MIGQTSNGGAISGKARGVTGRREPRRRLLRRDEWRKEGASLPRGVSDYALTSVAVGSAGAAGAARYANDEQLVKDRFCAASVVAAYGALIMLPEKERNAVIRDLRAAMRSSQSDAATDPNA